MDLKDHANLVVHWGQSTDGIQAMDLDQIPGDPNAGVFDIVEIVDRNRLKISPAGRADGEANYSVGRRSYGSFRVANCEFFMLDTRSHRSLHDVDNPDQAGGHHFRGSSCSKLKDAISNSDADFFLWPLA